MKHTLLHQSTSSQPESPTGQIDPFEEMLRTIWEKQKMSMVGKASNPGITDRKTAKKLQNRHYPKLAS